MTEAGASTHQRFSLNPAALAPTSAGAPGRGTASSPSPSRRRGPAGSRGLDQIHTLRREARFVEWSALFAEAVASFSQLSELVAADGTCQRVRGMFRSRGVWLERLEKWASQRRLRRSWTEAPRRPTVPGQHAARPAGTSDDDDGDGHGSGGTGGPATAASSSVPLPAGVVVADDDVLLPAPADADDASRSRRNVRDTDPRSIFTGIANAVREAALRRGKPMPRRTHFDGAMTSEQWKTLLLRRVAEDVTQPITGPTRASKGGMLLHRSVAPLAAQADDNDLSKPCKSRAVILRCTKGTLRRSSHHLTHPAMPGAVPMGREFYIPSLDASGPSQAVGVFLWARSAGEGVGIIVRSHVPIHIAVTVLTGGELPSCGPSPVSAWEGLGPSLIGDSLRVEELPRRRRNADGGMTPTEYAARFSFTVTYDTLSPVSEWAGRLIGLSAFDPDDEDAAILFEVCESRPAHAPVFRPDRHLVRPTSAAAAENGGGGGGHDGGASAEDDSWESESTSADTDSEASTPLDRSRFRGGRPPAPFTDHMPRWNLAVDREFKPVDVERDALVCPVIATVDVYDHPCTSDAMRGCILEHLAELAYSNFTIRERYLLQRAFLPRAIAALRSPRLQTRRSAQSSLWNLSDTTYNALTLPEIDALLSAIHQHGWVDLARALDSVPEAARQRDRMSWLAPAVGCMWNVVVDIAAAETALHHGSQLFFKIVALGDELIAAAEAYVADADLSATVPQPVEVRNRYELLLAVAQHVSSVLAFWPQLVARLSTHEVAAMSTALRHADGVLLRIASFVLAHHASQEGTIVMGTRDACDFGVRLMVSGARSPGHGCVALGAAVLHLVYHHAGGDSAPPAFSDDE